MDRYTKAILTVIALALVWLCLWGPGPRWGTAAQAESGPVPVNIAQVGGKSVSYGSLPIRVDEPVEVEGTPGGYPVTVKVR